MTHTVISLLCRVIHLIYDVLIVPLFRYGWFPQWRPSGGSRILSRCGKGPLIAIIPKPSIIAMACVDVGAGAVTGAGDVRVRSRAVTGFDEVVDGDAGLVDTDLGIAALGSILDESHVRDLRSIGSASHFALVLHTRRIDHGAGVLLVQAFTERRLLPELTLK